jgi:ADP-ribosyl-[dinitrogen reductase] hydrolase
MVALTPEQADRANGVLLGTAVGDALGAGYEFGPPLPDDAPVAMIGGGPFGWAPGEWTDDTSMAVAIAEVAAKGLDLRTPPAQDAIVARWYDWSRTAGDVGNQTRSVLNALSRQGATAAAAREVSQELHESTGHTAGNGSLMRTAPIALAYLDDDDALIEATTAISDLTHYDPENGEACVLWCLAIAQAVRTGELDVRQGLARLPSERQGIWADRIEVAEAARPSDFVNNGWVVEAFQGAWSAIAATSELKPALETAVRGGRDTDTVAAIAGGLAGAAYGAAAVPPQWLRLVHGWPGLDSDGLARLTAGIVSNDE